MSAVVAVGLVDSNAVDQLENAAFDALKLITCAGQDEQKEEVRQQVDSSLRLSYSYCLNENDAIASGLSEEDRLAGAASDTAKVSGGR